MGRVVEHVGLLGDAAAFALVQDALDHAGPASLSRVSAAACLRLLMPGIDAVGYAAALPVLAANFAAAALTAPWVSAEPALRGYATNG